MWLWGGHDHLAFDVSERFGGFHEFQDEVQFTSVAQHLARQAADELLRLRQRFPDVAAVAGHYRNAPPPLSLWPSFNAGVACGLTRDVASAHRFLGSLCATQPEEPDWTAQLRRDAALLLSQLEDRRQFVDTVAARVARTRELLKLPPASPRLDG